MRPTGGRKWGAGVHWKGRSLRGDLARRLLSVTKAVEAGDCGQAASGWGPWGGGPWGGGVPSGAISQAPEGGALDGGVIENARGQGSAKPLGGIFFRKPLRAQRGQLKGWSHPPPLGQGVHPGMY